MPLCKYYRLFVLDLNFVYWEFTSPHPPPLPPLMGEGEGDEGNKTCTEYYSRKLDQGTDSG
jgi:hypothetical protein